MRPSRKMPNHNRVLSYWSDELVRMGKFQDGELREHSTQAGRRGLCFACGWERPLERAHIHAKCEGGSDEVDNLHLLCHSCHRHTEFLSGGSYWEWFTTQDQWSAGIQALCFRNPELARLMYSALCQVDPDLAGLGAH
jgi:hypothetical protein